MMNLPLPSLTDRSDNVDDIKRYLFRLVDTLNNTEAQAADPAKTETGVGEGAIAELKTLVVRNMKKAEQEWEQIRDTYVQQTAFDSHVTAADQRMGLDEESISALEGRADAAEGDIELLDGRMSTAEGNITTLTGRMITAEGRLDTAEGRIDTVESRIDADEGRLDTAEGKIETSEASIGDLILWKSGVADRVTEEAGDDNGWSWRKWESGRVEAWYNSGVIGEVEIAEVNQGVYSDPSIDNVELALPDGVFGEAPTFCSINVLADSHAISQISDSTGTTITYRIWRSYDGMGTMTINNIHIYCSGVIADPEE